MPTISDLLHDRVDKREDLLEQARDMVAAVLRDRIDDALASSGQDVQAALSTLAVIVANELSPTTTEAVRSGFEHARKVAGLM